MPCDKSLPLETETPQVAHPFEGSANQKEKVYLQNATSIILNKNILAPRSLLSILIGNGPTVAHGAFHVPLIDMGLAFGL